MRRDLPFVLLALLALARAGAADAQPAAKVYRVGILCLISCGTSDVRTFRAALARAGYKEGSNIAFEFRSARGDNTQLRDLADDLVRRKVDVIYTTWGTTPGLAAKQATASIPVVVGSAGDPVATGIVKSLSRPEGNVTGISSLALRLEGKRLELLKQLLPTISRVALFRDDAVAYSVLETKQQRIAAIRLGVTLKEIQIHKTSDIDQGFAAIARDRLKALCIEGYAALLAGRKRIVRLAAKYRIPAIYPFRDFVDAGGLLSYGSNLNENAKRAAAQVEKILAGAKSADIPVEQSTEVELVINLKTAKALGVTIPPLLLARADEVIR